jgi:KDO2-lipid IV(A) lauroyltransferase
MASPEHFWNTRYASLRYGIVWIAFAWMRLLVRLPFAWQLRFGKWCGRLARRVARKRARIAHQNLRTCFPQMAAKEIEALVAAHFEALGASIVEMAMGWYGSEQTIRQRVRIQGEEHLRAALDRGKGVILFSAHFTSSELIFPVLAPLCPRLSGMYKKQRNPLMNEVMNAGRGRSADFLFAKDNVRDMLRELKRNSVVWYASDQSYAGKSSALIPFFGEPAMTNTAISRIARSTGAAVLPYYCRRLEDDTYVATIGAPLDGIPSEDAAADVLRLTQDLEAFISTCPEQYWWIHKRFKGRPAPYPDIYGRGEQA